MFRTIEFCCGSLFYNWTIEFSYTAREWTNHRGAVSKYIYIVILSGRRPPFRAGSGRETGVSDTKIWCTGPKANDRKHVCTTPNVSMPVCKSVAHVCAGLIIVHPPRLDRPSSCSPDEIERGRIWCVVFPLHIWFPTLRVGRANDVKFQQIPTAVFPPPDNYWLPNTPCIIFFLCYVYRGIYICNESERRLRSIGRPCLTINYSIRRRVNHLSARRIDHACASSTVSTPVKVNFDRYEWPPPTSSSPNRLRSSSDC